MEANRYFDRIAQFGAGSAHPGGFKETLDMLAESSFCQGEKVLEVGCGTGRTSCYLSKEYKCEVTGLDQHSLMIAKAKKRAELENVRAIFVIGDAYALPFPNEAFDTVIMESVSGFLDMPKVYMEIHRVLKMGGRLINLELFANEPLSNAQQKNWMEYYGVNSVPTLDQWNNAIKGAGFSIVKQRQDSLNMLQNVFSELSHPDQLAANLRDENAAPMGAEQPIFEYSDLLGYGIVIASK